MANTISDKLTYLEGTKSAIKDAIVAKGVAVEDTATFRSYAEKIGEISGGGEGKIDLSIIPLSLGYSNMHQFRDGGELKLEDYFILNKSSYADFFCGCEWSENDEFTFDCQGKNMNNMFYTTSSSNAIHKIILLNSTHTQGSQLFYNCQHLVEIDANLKLSQYFQTFSKCSRLLTLPNIDFSIATTLSGIFNYCESIEAIPDIYAPNCTGQTNQMFNYCKKLKSLGKITISPDKSLDSSAFGYTFGSSYWLPELTEFGGVATGRSFTLVNLPSLTASSVDNVLEAVSDLTGTSTQTITFHSAVYDALTEEQKALATSKNWTLASA